MALTRTNRSYFKENNTITNTDGSVVPGDRWGAGHEPTQDTMFKVLDSIAFITEVDDRATNTTQGLVKTVNGSSAKSGTTPTDGFTYVATIANLPQVKAATQTIGTLTAALINPENANEANRNVYNMKLSDEFLAWLSQSLSDLQTSLDNLTPRVNNLETSVSSIESDISTIQSDISTIQGQISTIQSDISTLQSRMDAAESEIDDLQDRVTANESAIAGFGGDPRSVGEYADMPVNQAPSSLYRLCDGQELVRDDFPALFALIGTTYGAGNGSTTFNLPDWSGKTTRGYNAADEPTFGLGVNGGNDSIVLTNGQLPPHDHTGITTTVDSLGLSDNAGTDATTVKKGDGTADSTLALNASTAHTGPTGGNSDPVDIKNPYLVHFRFIKVL